MSHLWFPFTQDTLSKGAKPGHWQGHSAQALWELASKLSYDGITTRINSLPTPWSRVVQIEQAITNPDYPTRRQLLDELFGCLAVVGLSDLYNLKLQVKTLQLEEVCDDPEPAVRRFATSLWENKPEASQSVLGKSPEGVSPWDRLMIFMVDDARTHQSQPVGFASPSSILCPTAQLRWPIDARTHQSQPVGFASASSAPLPNCAGRLRVCLGATRVDLEIPRLTSSFNNINNPWQTGSINCPVIYSTLDQKSTLAWQTISVESWENLLTVSKFNHL